LDLAFHGVPASVLSSDPECLTLVEADFSLFLTAAPPAGEAAALVVQLAVGQPPYERIPEGTTPLVRTKDAVVYQHRGVRYYDSGGKALVIYDLRHGHAEVHSLDRDLLREKCYLLVMTRVGEELDRRGLHRIHAMGVVHGGHAVLCLMPSGAGKTTLALSLLERRDFSLLSEEVPLVSRGGRLHAFPIRIGVVEGTPLAVPSRFLHRFRRSRRGPKVLIDTRYYADRIADVAEPGMVLVGRRVGPGEAGVAPLSRLRGLAALMRFCVAGSGLPELLEYLLRLDLGCVGRRLLILWSRFLASVALVRRSAVYEIRLGPDHEVNAALVAQWAARLAPLPRLSA
jgi:hypothetical protein